MSLHYFLLNGIKVVSYLCTIKAIMGPYQRLSCLEASDTQSDLESYGLFTHCVKFSSNSAQPLIMHLTDTQQSRYGKLRFWESFNTTLLSPIMKTNGFFKLLKQGAHLCLGNQVTEYIILTPVVGSN